MTFLKPYAEFTKEDFSPIVQEIKLHKIKKGSRITNYGELADSINVIVSGRVAITHPNALYMEIYEAEGPKGLRERAQIMTDKQVKKELEKRTFITATGALGGPGDKKYEEDMRNKRLAEAKTKNQTF